MHDKHRPADLEFLIVRAVSAGGRAWDQRQIEIGDTGPIGIACVMISPFGPGRALCEALQAKDMGRLLVSRDDHEATYRVLPEHFISGPFPQSLELQSTACGAFAAVLNASGVTAKVAAYPDASRII